MTSLGLSFAGSVIGGTLKSMSPFTKDKKMGNINWGDYNYPPCLSIVHYDPEDVTDESKKATVKIMHRVFLITVVVCALNLVSTIVDASLYADAKKSWILYSILNLFVIPPLAMYIFFSGYKAMALSDSSLMSRYSLMGTIQAIFYFLFTITPFGALNGLLSFAMYQVGWFWTAAILIESGLWATAFGMAVYTVVFVVRGDYLTLPIATTTK
jgi:hypothetical protein